MSEDVSSQGYGAEQGTVIDLTDGVATVVLSSGEEWLFPADLLPDGVGADDVVFVAGHGRDLRITGRDPLAPSVESRLNRSMARRRLLRAC